MDWLCGLCQRSQDISELSLDQEKLTAELQAVSVQNELENPPSNSPLPKVFDPQIHYEGEVIKHQIGPITTVFIDRWAKLTHEHFVLYKTKHSELFGGKPIRTVALSEIKQVLLSKPCKMPCFEVEVKETNPAEKCAKAAVKTSLSQQFASEAVQKPAIVKKSSGKISAQTRSVGLKNRLLFGVSTVAELSGWVEAFENLKVPISKA